MSSVISRRVKYSGHKSKINHSDKVINKNLDLNVLNLLCSYLMCNNRNIRKGGYINLRNFIHCLNMDIYENEPDKQKRIEFIKKGLDARINKNLNNPTMIMNHINGGFLEDDLLNVETFAELDNKEIDFVNDMVTKSLYYTFIDNEIDTLLDLCIKWKASDFQGKGDLIVQFEDIINKMHNKFRQSKVDPMGQITFALREDKFEQAIADIYNKATDPSRKIISGMQGFNDMVGGALFAARIYILLGISGVGKSITLLNLAYQMKKYNTTLKPKDPTKRPCVVYLTMENDVVETVERLFQISTGLQLTSLTIDDVIKELRTTGELFISDQSPIDIIIKFVPDSSVDTGYLYLLTEDLEDDGYEVVAFILDHIKRIRSAYNHKDIRLELGAVVNECKTFATIKDIPFITNSHLNREANVSLDKCKEDGKVDLTKALGAKNIGESMLMRVNADCVIFINEEYDAEGNKYIVLMRDKIRYSAKPRTYICYPFLKNNPIRLMDDLFCPEPAYRESLYNIDYSSFTINTGVSNIRTSNYCTIGNLDDSVKVYTEDTKPEKNTFLNIEEMETIIKNISNALCPQVIEGRYRSPIILN